MGHFLYGLADLARPGAKSKKVAVLDARPARPNGGHRPVATCWPSPHFDYQSQQSFCLILKLV